MSCELNLEVSSFPLFCRVKLSFDVLVKCFWNLVFENFNFLRDSQLTHISRYTKCTECESHSKNNPIQLLVSHGGQKWGWLGDAPASFWTSMGNDHHYRRGLWRRVLGFGGHGGPSKPFGNLWERAQFVMEKVLEKRANKWRCFLAFIQHPRVLYFLLDKHKKISKEIITTLKRNRPFCKDPKCGFKTHSLLCYVCMQRRKLSLMGCCPFFIRV
jgi:hypothetical protein